MRLPIRCWSFFAAAILGGFWPDYVSADVELGILSCRSVPHTRGNRVIQSTVEIKCTLEYAGGAIEYYKGETGIALGLDLSFTDDEKFAFTVISASAIKPGKHPVAGKYLGGKASVAAGLGIGAAALVGGSDDSFGLNPLVLESNRGVGIAGGIGFLFIVPDI